jgi:hypothetical protein
VYLFKNKDVSFVDGACKLHLFYVYRFRCNLLSKDVNVASLSANASSLKDILSECNFTYSAIF